MPAAHGWAALPPDLVQHVAGFLADEERMAIISVCRPWDAAIEAMPELWPTVVLRAPDSRVTIYASHLSRPASLRGLLELDARVRAALLTRAARVDPRPHVRLEGFWQSPDLVTGVLACLPPRTARLQLACRCMGPALAMLAPRPGRTSPTDISISGNGAEVDWLAPGTAQVLPLLSHLRLDYSRPEYQFDNGIMDEEWAVAGMPGGLSALLRGATRLRNLDLSCGCPVAAGELCAALLALRSLTLTLLNLNGGDDDVELQAGVEALQRATQVTALRLVVSTSSYVSGSGRNPTEDAWQEELGENLMLPPLSGLAALTSLQLEGLAALPPDWRELSQLCSLSLRRLFPQLDARGAAPATHDFSQLPTALTGLTGLCLVARNCLTPAMCCLGALRELTVLCGSSEDSPAPADVSQLSALTKLCLHDSWPPGRAGAIAVHSVPPVRLLPALRQLAIECLSERQQAWAEALGPDTFVFV